MKKGVDVSAPVRSVGRTENGSALLFALFACMVAAMCVHVLAATVICGERALADESSGRDLLAATDGCLSGLRSTASEQWGAEDWAAVEVGEIEVMGRLVEAEEPTEWVLRAESREPTPAPLGITSALVERGRDGLDLPFAAVVTACVRSEMARSTPWLLRTDATAEGEDRADVAPATADGSGARAYVDQVEGSVFVADGCSIEALEGHWSLDDGWRALFGEGVSPGSRAWAVEGWPGQSVYIPGGANLSIPESPVLVVAVGGATLDLRDLGDVWGVFVADKGSVLLEGTVVHGAIYATECVDVGENGAVIFDERVLRWACDRSLVRVRLVPGSRVEGIEEGMG